MTRIKERILDKHKHARDFARYMSGKYGAGWDEGMISRLACGRCWPTPEALGLLCRELDCEAGDLYDAYELEAMAQMGLAGLAGLAQAAEDKP